MWRARVRALLVLAWAASAGAAAGSRYAFYRSLRGDMGRRQAGEARRVFGGTASPLSAFPSTCMLVDRYMMPRCSASVLSPHWVLTAAHCVSPVVAYVKYNARRPTDTEGDVSAVSYLYRHPCYKVRQADEGHGIDVTELHHDVGLLRTRTNMRLVSAPARPPLRSMSTYNLEKLKNQEVQVLGYGRTESGSLGEQLFQVRLHLERCPRSSWEHCMCGMGTERSGARGVCSGDSGGPVLYRGVQVGVTSMGPMECAQVAGNPPESATSVFTSLYPYTGLVNQTMFGTDEALKMRLIEGGAASHRAAPRLLAAVGAALLARPAR